MRITYTGLLHLDRTVELLTGRVTSPQVHLHYEIVDRPGDLFARQSKNADLELSEMSVSTYLMMLDRGDLRLIGLPIFLSRCFRHRHVYLHSGAGISSPEELRGRRIGIPEYQMTAGLWSRGFLSDDYGVTPDSVTWVTGPLRTRTEKRRAAWEPPSDIEVQSLPLGMTLETAIAEGAVDALITVDVPAVGLGDNSGVVRLFPNYVEVEQTYFARTGSFPIMHLLALRRDIYEENRWLAAELFRMFCDARRLGRSRLEYDGSLPVSLPWIAHELSDNDRLLGTNPFRYGVEASRTDLEVMLRYAREQGIVRGVGPAVEDLFAPETLVLEDSSTSPALSTYETMR